MFRNQEKDADAKLGGINTGGKTDNDSKRWRELGNQAFKAGNDRKAVQLYNEAVVYAPQRLAVKPNKVKADVRIKG